MTPEDTLRRPPETGQKPGHPAADPKISEVRGLATVDPSAAEQRPSSLWQKIKDAFQYGSGDAA